jgi:membrane protease YdiL (CAAX protease family)
MVRILLGIALALAITASLDANGLSSFSALPLLPLMVIFWWWQRLSRAEAGFTVGAPKHFGLAIAHPLLVIGILAVCAILSGAMDTTHTDWRKAFLNLGIMIFGTVVVAMVTEEGFFRGWLWGSVARLRQPNLAVLCWTSLAFAAWHVSAVAFPTEFHLPMRQVPVFLINAAVLGAIWGMLRLISGSVLVASAGHGVWNGLAYILFGIGTRPGALGIAATAWFGPEVGLLGLGLNAACLAALCLQHRVALLGRSG